MISPLGDGLPYSLCLPMRYHLCGVIGCRAFSRAPADEPRRIDEYLGDLPELALVTKVLADTSLHESLGDRTMERIHGFS